MNQKTKRHWLTMAACCGIFASSIGIGSNSMGVFITPVSEALGVGRGSFALCMTISALVTGFITPVTTKLVNSRSLRWLLLGGTLLSAACIAAMAFSRSIWIFYALGVLRGVALSTCSLVVVTTIIGNWFEAKYGLAMGVALSFSGLSGAVFSPLFSSLIQAVGWQQSFLWMAALSVALALPGVLFLRLRPEDCSLLPYGASQPRTEYRADRAGTGGKALWASLPFLLLIFLALTQNFITGIAQHFPGYGETLGVSANTGALMISAGMVGNIIYKLLIGVLSDRFGPFKSCIGMISVNCAALLALLFLPRGSSGLALAAAFFYGAVYSVTAVGMSVVTRRLFGVERYASVYSIVNIMTCVGNAVSLTIIGGIYDMTGGYALAFLLAIAFDLLGLGILWYISRRARQGVA